MFSGHKGPISCIAVDGDGSLLFTASMDKTVRSWDISLGRCMKVFEGHENGVLSLQVYRTMLYTGSTDGTAKAWVIEFGECTRTFKGHEHSVNCLAVAGGIREWIRTKKSNRTFNGTD